MAGVNKRPYRTRIRRGDAPALVRAAATDLFIAKGYAATSIDDIAAAAGVARPTVFTAVGTKPTILKAVVDQATVGDDVPVPLSDRPWYQEALDEPDLRRSLRLLARNMSRIAQGVAPLLRAVEHAAASDPEVAELWQDLQQQRRQSLTLLATALCTKAPLRLDQAAVVDTLWALQPSTYQRLVLDADWTPQEWESWLGDLFERLLVG
jgi:AcrR family transcriptional regulator